MTRNMHLSHVKRHVSKYNFPFNYVLGLRGSVGNGKSATSGDGR